MGTPRLVTCEEQGPIDLPLDEVLDGSGRLRLNPEIEGGDYFAVSLRGGVLSLRARGMVGYIPLNERVVVQVRPRVPVSNLSRIVRISGLPPTILTSVRGYATSEEWNDSLLDVYAAALTQHLEGIVSSGLLREYVRREEVSSFPRGRVQLHRTLQTLQARGIKHRAVVTWFERSADVAPNRALKYALWLLAQRYIRLADKTREQRRLHRKLTSLYRIFDSVELDHRRFFLRAAQVQGTRPLPAIRAYYRDALSVALAIVEQRSVLIESPTGSLRLPSLVLNMNYVFEAYTRNVLMHYAEAHNWSMKVLDGNTNGARKLFDTQPSPDATPDVVVRTPDGSTLVVIEVKNIPVNDRFSDRNALNQALTYALTYRTNRVLLVHPRASQYQAGGLHRLGEVNGISVYQYRFDLGSAALLDEEAAYGRAVGHLVAD